jgi:hypothetical protein
MAGGAAARPRGKETEMRGVIGAAWLVLAMIAASAGSAQAATISYTGTGGAVPDGNSAGASFDISIPDPGIIASAGSSVTLTLVNVSTNTTNPSSRWAPYGGLVDFAAALEHVGHGPPRTVFANVLNQANFICVAGLNGTYAFKSGAPTTLRSQCGTGNIFNQPRLIAPGTYRTTAAGDTSDSNLSSAWNFQPVAGTWRLRITDTNVSTGANEFVLNATWTWRLDIELSGTRACKKGGWKTLGPFKNQGDCVSFVSTGGKNPPAGSRSRKPKKHK